MESAMNVIWGDVKRNIITYEKTNQDIQVLFY